MTEPNDQFEAMKEWLKSLGHSDEEIAKIVHRVQEYDHNTGIDSIMDSIAAGRFDIKQFIRETLEG